jgi:DNA-binding beta-propeller fold protein YncE
MDHLHIASPRSRFAIAVSTVVALIAALILVVSPSRSLAVGTGDQIYWGNESGSVRSGNLGGGGAADVFASESPCGVAIDSAASKIYWANFNGGGIRVGNLNGSGATTLFNEGGNALCGVAVNPAAGKIYWANFTTNTIKVGNLNGSGTPSTLFTEPPGSAPSGVAIDPAAGKIYWTNQFTDQVRVGNLNGFGSASTLFGSDAPAPTVERNPIGVAINPAAGKIYWTDLGSCCSGPGQVRVGNLDGTSTPSTLFDGEGGPGGLAIDPGANKIYWATFGPGVIRSGPLDGSAPASTLFSGESFSLFAALLKSPVNTGRPEISGGAKVGKELTCQNGTWAPDLLGAFLYRAPASFAYQWKRNGGDIATGPTFMPNLAGDYTCTVTATNQAGSTSQTSSVKKVKNK